MEPASCTSGACLEADGKGVGCFARHLAVVLGAVHPARSAAGAAKALTAQALSAMQAALEAVGAAWPGVRARGQAVLMRPARALLR